MRRSSSSSTPDGRSQSNSNGKKSSGIWRKKADSKSKATSRDDDRDRSLADLPADSASPSSGRRSYEPSVASESAAKVDRDTRGARGRDREPSSSPEPVPRRLNGNQSRSRDDSANEESNRRREPQRWPPDDVSLPPLDTGAAHTTSDQFAADIASPGFSQFPMQYDNNYNYDSPNYSNPVSIPPPLMPGHPDSSPTSPATFDPHVPQQFPGQFPDNTAEPYLPYNNPAGEAADYYGDQGQSVQEQPGVRPNPPLVIPNSQAHLMPASPGANPPPEPSSMGQVGSAAEFYADSPDLDNPVSQQQPPEEPPKPSKPNKPSAVPAGIPSGPPSHDIPDSPMPPEAPGSAGTQPVGYTQNSPTQSHSMGPAIGAAAAAAAVGYMANHHSNSSTSSSEHPFPSSYMQNHEPYSPIGQPGPAIYPNPALNNPNHASHPNHPNHEAIYHSSPFQSGGLAFQQRQRGPLDKFIDFWKDHEGVGMYEEYTEAIGVCKYCFEPGTTSRDAPRKHNYRPRRRSSDRFSNDSRVNKSSRYPSPSDDESRRRRNSSKRSWFGGLFSGSTAKALFESQDFEDSYNVRPSRVSSPRLSSSDSESDSDRKSKPSRRRRRSSLSKSPGGSRRNSYPDSRRSRYEGPRLRSRSQSRSSSDSRSRSSSRSDHHSPIRDFALGAAVGSVTAAATSHPRKKHSRSPKRKGKGRKESTTEDSSSSSYLDISRPTTAGSLGSFFNTPSENKKKSGPKSRKGFFPFSNNNSSSSSLDSDLAFGTAYAKKPKKSKKGKGKKKGEDVNAKLLELSAMATALAGSTRGRRSGEILAGKDSRSRRPQSAPSVPKDDEWEDYSEGQESSVSSALAFGGSSQYGSSSSEDSSDSGTSKWNWRWGSKKDKKKNEQKKDSPSHDDFPTGSILAGTALGTAALASGYRKEGEHFSSPSSSSSESLQQLDPIPAPDPPRFNASSFPPSSAQEPAFIRPGPIPLQQPQPVTPVSQAVYSSQGEPAPVYNAPTVPPFFPPDAFYDPASGRRDDVYPQRSDVSSNWNRTHRRRESSPDFYPGPFQDFTPSSYKRRPTDQASVQFDLTEEQKDKERRATCYEGERRDNDRDQDIRLLDHESEEENERREPRRVERLELEPERGRSRSRSRSSTRRDRSPNRRRWDDDDSSSWIGPAAAGTIGAAVAAAAIPSGPPSEGASESSQRHRERSEKRRAERVPPFSEVVWDWPARADVDERPEPRPEPARAEPKEEPRIQSEPADVDVEDKSQIAPKDSSRPGKNPTTRTPRTKPTHESYATYFALNKDRHSSDARMEHGENASMSTIPEDEPQPPPQQDIEPPSKYLGGLPWTIPRLNLIEPTPPHSQNGSVRDVASPDPPAAEHSQKEEAPRREQGSTTGSRVSWGGNETHEYEVHSTSSEQESDYELADEPDDMQRNPVDRGVAQESVGMPRDPVDHGMAQEPEGVKRGPIQQDIEFATILDATTKDAGFDPAIMTADTHYNTRSSPPQAEHREFSEYQPSWQKPAHYVFEPHGASRDEVQTPHEEREPETMGDAPEAKQQREAIGHFDTPKAKETMPGSFEEEPVQPTEDPSHPVVEEKRPIENNRRPRRRSSRDSARDDPRKTAIDVSRPESISEEPQSEKEREPVSKDVSSKEDRGVRALGEFAPIALAAFPPKPISEEPQSVKKQEPVKNETPWEDYHHFEAPRESELPVSPPSPGSGYRMSQDDLNKSEFVFRETPGETERPVSPPSPGSGYRMSQDDLNKSELVLGEIPRAPSPSGYRLSQDDLSKSELVFGEMPRAPSPSGYRLSQDDLDRSEFVLEDNRKPIPPREKEPAPAISRLPLRRERRSQDKLHSRNDNVPSSDKGSTDAAPVVSAPEPARQERRKQSQSNRTDDGPLKDNDKPNYSFPAFPKPKEADEDCQQSTRAPSGDTPDIRDRGQPTSQQQQQRPLKSETTTRQGPKEPSSVATPREPPNEEYRGRDGRDVAPEEARKARGSKDTAPAPRPLIWNERRSEDGPAPAVKDDASFENNSQPRVSEETPSDEFVLAPNGEGRRRRDEPDSNNDNVPENDRGARGEEDINAQRYRFSRQQREEKRQREERRRQEAEGIAGPNGQTREEYEKV